MSQEIVNLERKIFALTQELNELRKSSVGNEVPDYVFQTVNGEQTLSSFFSGHDQLLSIHNMGQGCRYCTVWADGFNGFLPHLESVMSVVLTSKDAPDIQRRFANARGWRFRLASHGGGTYIQEQGVGDKDAVNMPGAVLYERSNGKIVRKNSTMFGPGDMFCSLWSLLSLAGMDAGSFTPQYSYWKEPKVLDDGGENRI